MEEETKIAVLQSRMDIFEKNMEKRFDSLEMSLKEFIGKSENKFSAKWVENAFKWFLYAIAAILVTASMSLIIMNPIK